jgi:hypothetical protein
MDTRPLNEEVNELARGIDQARAAVQRNEWELALRALTEAQDRIGRLLKEIGDKSRDVMLTPKPEMQAIAGKG